MFVRGVEAQSIHTVPGKRALTMRLREYVLHVVAMEGEHLALQLWYIIRKIGEMVRHMSLGDAH